MACGQRAAGGYRRQARRCRRCRISTVGWRSSKICSRRRAKRARSRSVRCSRSRSCAAVSWLRRARCPAGAAKRWWSRAASIRSRTWRALRAARICCFASRMAATLRAPLLVRPGAGLVIAGSRARPLRLRLDQEAGAFVVNTGTLHIAWASILGWSSSQQALAATGGERFRPFLAGLRRQRHHRRAQRARSSRLRGSQGLWPLLELAPTPVSGRATFRRAFSRTASTSSTTASSPMRRGGRGDGERVQRLAPLRHRSARRVFSAADRPERDLWHAGPRPDRLEARRRQLDRREPVARQYQIGPRGRCRQQPQHRRRAIG